MERRLVVILAADVVSQGSPFESTRQQRLTKKGTASRRIRHKWGQ